MTDGLYKVDFSMIGKLVRFGSVSYSDDHLVNFADLKDQMALIVDVNYDDRYALYFPFCNGVYAWFTSDKFEVVSDLLSDWRCEMRATSERGDENV